MNMTRYLLAGTSHLLVWDRAWRKAFRVCDPEIFCDELISAMGLSMKIVFPSIHLRQFDQSWVCVSRIVEIIICGLIYRQGKHLLGPLATSLPDFHLLPGSVFLDRLYNGASQQ